MIPSQRHIFGMALVLIASCCTSVTVWADSDLLTAARRGDLSRVKTLLGAKTDVNETREDGVTALIAASTTGHLAVVQALLDDKADVSARMTNGGTALMAAAAVGNRQVVRALLDAYAGVNVRELREKRECVRAPDARQIAVAQCARRETAYLKCGGERRVVGAEHDLRGRNDVHQRRHGCGIRRPSGVVVKSR